METKRPENPEGEKEQLRLKFLEKMRTYRYEFVDDLPPQRVFPWDNDPNYYKYKCRMAFFTGIRADAERMISKGVITDPVVISKAHEFDRYIREVHPFPEFTRREDIEVANQFLDVLIASLS
jgi:hypothetical protein